MDVSQRGEFGLIAHLHQGLSTRAGTKLGIGDDGAVLQALAHPIVTTDALVEQVHFRRDWTSAYDLGIKAMAVNLSDLAAMGAHPVAAFISLALPPDCESEWITKLYAGMESLAARYNFTVAGGDMTSAPLIMMSVTLIGDLMPEALGAPVLRSGARVGDLVCVTGALGMSAAGLALLQAPEVAFEKSNRAALLHVHHRPTPRLDAMRALLGANRDALHAGLDLSDGLAGDALHIARASGVNIEVDADKLPIWEGCRALARILKVSPLDWALSGGEDYELCLCAAPQALDELRAACPINLTVVGRVVEGAGEVRVYEDGQLRPTATGWRHF